jgi:hypothetical protein
LKDYNLTILLSINYLPLEQSKLMISYYSISQWYVLACWDWHTQLPTYIYGGSILILFMPSLFEKCFTFTLRFLWKLDTNTRHYNCHWSLVLLLSLSLIVWLMSQLYMLLIKVVMVIWRNLLYKWYLVGMYKWYKFHMKSK